MPHAEQEGDSKVCSGKRDRINALFRLEEGGEAINEATAPDNTIPRADR